MNLARFLHGVLKQKRALEQDLAARSAAGAFALTLAEQPCILFLIDVRPEKTANLSCRLLRAKLESR